jgi:hypothetical protein
LEKAATDSSSTSVQAITAGLDNASLTTGLLAEINEKVRQFAAEAAKEVKASRQAREKALPRLDAESMSRVGTKPAFAARYALFSGACAMAGSGMQVSDPDFGSGWTNFVGLRAGIETFKANLKNYNGPLALDVSNACWRVSGEMEATLQQRYVDDYVAKAGAKLDALSTAAWTIGQLTEARRWHDRFAADFAAAPQFLAAQDAKLQPLRARLPEYINAALAKVDADVKSRGQFPLVLRSTPAMKPADMAALNKELRGLLDELRQPAWANSKSEVPKSMQAYSDVCAAILQALVNTNGTPAQARISFVPSKTPADVQVLAIYRQGQLTAGGKSSEWQELTQFSEGAAPVELMTGSLDGGLAIKFRKGSEESTPFRQEGWWLPQLILANPASVVRLEEGRKWRFGVALTDVQAGQTFKGQATFEVELLSGALPAPDKWPK